MLVITRREGETVVFPDLDITVTITKIWSNKARVAIDAPRQINVVRGEIEERKDAKNTDRS